MADDITTEADEQTEGTEDAPGDLRKMLKEANAERARLKRELAFRDAGVPTESGPGKLLFQAYDGEMSGDAVKAAALEYGIGGTADPDQTTTEKALPNPAAATVAAGDAVLDDLRSSTTSVEPQGPASVVNEATHLMHEANTKADRNASEYYGQHAIAAEFARVHGDS